MNVRKNYTPWVISAQLKHPHGLKDQPQTLYLTDGDEHGPYWAEDTSGDCLFYGNKEMMMKYVEIINENAEDNSGLSNVTFYKVAAESLSNQGQEVLSVRLEQVVLIPAMEWEFKDGKTTKPTILESLHNLWNDTYACFRAVFDTPIARRKDNTECVEEARILARKINDIVNPTILR